MDIDTPQEPIASSSAVAPHRSSRKRRLCDIAEESIVDTPPRKKVIKARNAPSKKKIVAVDLTREDDEVEVVNKAVLTTKKISKNNIPTAPAGEKRLRRWRERAPQSFQAVYDRAMQQRMFVIDRSRNGDKECPEETLTIAGTTGNLYTVTIARIPSCDCPHALNGNQCKHVLYVMCRVLHAPQHLQYQLAFVASELREIFEKAPPIPAADADTTGSNRKPYSPDEDCPICCMPFEPEKEEIVFCEAACGNNVHKECFEQWAATKTALRAKVTCPFCRTPWQGNSKAVRKLAKEGNVNAEGYINVASQLGLSGRRDYSSYNRFWVRQQRYRGVDIGDDYYEYD